MAGVAADEEEPVEADDEEEEDDDDDDVSEGVVLDWGASNPLLAGPRSERSRAVVPRGADAPTGALFVSPSRLLVRYDPGDPDERPLEARADGALLGGVESCRKCAELDLETERAKMEARLDAKSASQQRCRRHAAG